MRIEQLRLQGSHADSQDKEKPKKKKKPKKLQRTQSSTQRVDNQSATAPKKLAPTQQQDDTSMMASNEQKENSTNNVLQTPAPIIPRPQRYLHDVPPTAWRYWPSDMKKDVHEIILNFTFPQVKFVNHIEDLNDSPFMGVIFRKLKHGDDLNADHRAFRSRYWSSMAQCVVDKIGMRRNNVIKSCRKTCMIGK